MHLAGSIRPIPRTPPIPPSMSRFLPRTLSLAAAFTAALLTASAARAQGSTSSQGGEGEVMAVVKRLFDGMRAGDSSMVRSVFHPQVRLISASTGRDGKPRLNVESSADNFAKAVGTPHAAVWDERIWNEKVQIDGPIASVWVDYSFRTGDTFSHCGIDHFLVVKDDAGAWKIIELADTRRTEGCDRSKD